jgi:uncharacterized protein YtpQ (UPF0354 family)
MMRKTTVCTPAGVSSKSAMIRGVDEHARRVSRKLRFADSGPRDASMIVPVIKRAEPGPSDDVIVLPPDSRPISDSLVGELIILYAFDLPGHFEYLSEHHCKTLGIDPHGLRKLAVRNLTRRRSKPEILRPSDTINMLRLDGDLEASLLLVDHLWPQAARAIAGEIVVGVPSRDVLAITGTGITDGIQTLRWAVDRAWKRQTNRKLRLTQSLLVRREDSWQIFESA